MSKIGGGSIFAGAQPSVASANDSSGVEVGVQFSSSTPLAIEGIRFFKGTGNTGTHIGNLWSSGGTLLASATFTSESAYGWQAVRFSQPVMIAAGATYVASYYAPHGGYAIDTGFFSSGPLSSGPLTATTGVFSYGSSSSFPSNTFDSSNYWVDVMYSSVVPAGSNAQFTISTTNTGAASGDVTLTDALPPGLSWTQDNSRCSIAGGTLSCDFGTLATRASQVVHLSAPTTIASCGTITNTAKVADSSATDTDALDKSATADVIVTCPAGVKSCQVSIASNFNGTAIPGGNYIWFNSVFKPKGVPSSGATIELSGANVSFTAGGKSYNMAVPSEVVTFSPSATKATLTFNGSKWVETVPASFADNVFLSGVPFLVPAGGLPGGISPVTWQGTITFFTSGVSLSWQWAAAVYSQFSTDLNALGVKPLHSTSLDQYPNGDQAGTPENFKADVIGGARGGGGANYTGSYSSTGTCG
jgi:uncharacterized repeat protein (TIGR01451 family)